jgi:hypothetical protein
LALVHCVPTITPTNEEDIWIIQSNAYSLRPLTKYAAYSSLHETYIVHMLIVYESCRFVK